MKCKQCGYRLWNLISRECPECGKSFYPGQYTFARNTVQFCCPHCMQPYYGTDENGLPTPRSFTCVGCERDIDLDEMVLKPAGEDEDATAPESHPWLDKKRRGFFGRFASSIFMAMTQPKRMIETVPPDSSLGSAWWFAILGNATYLFVAVIPMLVFFAAMPAFLTPPPGVGGTPIGVAGLGPMIAAICGCYSVGWVIVFAVGVLIWGGVTQLLLKLTGPTEHPINRTYQALLYSSGANATLMVPFCGFYVSGIWWLVSAVVAVMEGQKVSGWRAAFSVLTMPLLAFAGLVAFYVVFFVAMMNNSGVFQNAAGQPGFPGSPMQKIQDVGSAVELYATLHPEQTARKHPVVYVQDNLIAPHDFIDVGSLTTLDDIPVGLVTLQRFVDLELNEKNRAVDDATTMLPPTDECYRVGDVVFIGLGDNTDWVTQGTWTVIMYPDPAFNPASPPIIKIRTYDGQSQMFPQFLFTQQLKGQNEAREAVGLPPIPHPSTLQQLQFESDDGAEKDEE